MTTPRLPAELLPCTATVSGEGLEVGGISISGLAAEHGTPLLVYDEEHLRARCRAALAAFPDGVSYASKAFLCRSLARLIHEEGLGLDVASGGELAIALSAGVPPSVLTMHGNNKSTAELDQALAAGVAHIVVDSAHELDRLHALTGSRTVVQEVLLRVNPAVTADTHRSMLTGHAASKFGVPLGQGRAAAIAARVGASRHLTLSGIHVHLGSQITDLDPLSQAICAAATFARDSGVADLVIGGGLGVPYTAGQEAPDLSDWAAVAHAAARAAGFEGRILAEPGRAVAATAGMTVYEIGTIKPVADGQVLLAVDGGISDNPRPALYQSSQQVLLARHPFVPASTPGGRYTVVGKNCESSDTFARGVQILGDPHVGDLLCVPVTGAYTYAMSSNYNGLCRPAVVFVRNGSARIVLRRETHDDLLHADLVA